ncbi:(2Fe-2S)-binding protein [Nocardiopsis gilva YIM 90087]|uniref:(2Fe-2S)-binding protein n=1 Tax=Nocardiopsis gilva YIM 90087 TaxID=1235441 RepID=A0A223S0L4_9ACTN|nr:NAD(P)/FAD-dependent oxidoreductase [Nocardiopsis gilva]ASU81673.1 (2Fe-2S)-binding protein [Nocardiopsis gilva YIM 90087]
MPNPTSDSAPHDGYDLAVIGAGCAGLAGAAAASELGLSVALLDMARQTGGQFYRRPAPELRVERPQALHHDWSVFTGLRRRVAASGVTRLTGHHVWSVTREDDGGGNVEWVVHAATGADGGDERPVRVRARAILLATGSYERHLPFPGWTLPGVVGAGGAQAMLKSGLVLPGRRVFVAGSGPLLLAVASSLAAAGARIPAVVEASGYLGYSRRPGVLAANPLKLGEAVTHGAALLRHRVRLSTRSAVTAAHGTDRVAAVTVSRLDRDWRPVPGSEHRIACDALAVGFGLAPQIELATALDCATRRAVDGTTALVLDGLQRTSVPGIWAAGETGGIGGAHVARVEGELAGIGVAAQLSGRGALVRTGRVRTLRRRRDRMRAFADVMAAAHAPGPGWTRWLTDDTDVCRCEEVTAADIREAVTDLGARDARSVKLLTRAGMGWCQGRMCGAAVTCLAASGGESVPPSAERRPFAVPITLAALSSPESPADADAPSTAPPDPAVTDD